MNEEKAIEQIRKNLRSSWLHWAGIAFAIASLALFLGWCMKVEGTLGSELADLKFPKDLNAAIHEGIMRDMGVLTISKVHTIILFLAAMLGLMIGGAVWSVYTRRKDRLLVSMWDRLKALESRLPPPAA